jgi:hypothetical protein
MQMKDRFTKVDAASSRVTVEKQLKAASTLKTGGWHNRLYTICRVTEPLRPTASTLKPFNAST